MRRGLSTRHAAFAVSCSGTGCVHNSVRRYLLKAHRSSLHFTKCASRVLML
jgi:hypothetical protein